MNPTYQSPCGRVVLYLADCLAVLPTLGKVDAVITDPPYGTEDGDGYGRRQNHEDGRGMGQTIANDTDLSALAAAAKFLAKPCAVFHSGRNIRAFCAATTTLGDFVELVWDKRIPGLGNPVRYQHEGIAVFGEPRGTTPCLSVAAFTRETGEHPHGKPEALLGWLTKFMAAPGDTVADVFMGSGTTGVAALRHGCNFIGVEISPVYFEIAKRRICAELAQRKMF